MRAQTKTTFTRAATLAAALAIPSAAGADVLHPGGTISTPTTWSAADNDHIVTGNISISQTGSLTIEAGAVVRLDGNVQIEVSGALIADGGGSGIIITRRDPGETSRGIFFYGSASGTITDCTIEYSSTAGVEVLWQDAQDPSVSITETTIRDCTIGIRAVDGGPPIISGCTIEDNTTGIRFDTVDPAALTSANTLLNNETGVRFAYCSGVVVDEQTIIGSGSTEGAIYVLLSGAFTIGPGNAITGNSWGLTIDVGSGPDIASAGNLPLAGNTNDDGIQVRGVTASNESATWRNLGADYIVTGYGFVSTTGSLTIDPGCTVRFDASRCIEVYGALDASGGVPGILFTERSPGAGWDGLRLSGATGTLENCTIEHASNTAAAGVRVENSTVTIRDCTIRSGDLGVFVNGGTMPVIEGCVIEDNITGIVVNAVSNGALTVANVLTNNATGITLSFSPDFVIDNQTITGSDGPYGAVYASLTGEITLGPGNSITGNSWGLTTDAGSSPSAASIGNIPVAGNTNTDGFQVRRGTLHGTLVWRNVGVDRIVTARPQVSNSGHLVIEDGNVLRFGSNIRLSITGRLDAEGDGAGIEFRPRDESLGWGGLSYWAGEGTLTGCTLWGVSGAGNAAARLDAGSSIAIVDSWITQNSYGVWIHSSSASLVRCWVVGNSEYGLRLSDPSTLTLGASLSEWNDIYYNGTIFNGRDLRIDTSDVEAPFVYWGSTDAGDIERAIYHEEDDPTLGRVTVEPYTDENHELGIGMVFADVSPTPIFGLDVEAAAFGDADGDSDPDLFVAVDGEDLLFRNDGGTFVDISPPSLFSPTLHSVGARWVDWDNDGDFDLAVTVENAQSRLYRNDAGTWVEFGLPTEHNWQDIEWADIDTDGDLDALCVPTTADGAHFYRNEGSGDLALWDSASEPDTPHDTAWSDFDADGDLDLIICGTHEGAPEATVYRMDAGLQRVIGYTNVGTTPYTSVTWADADGDGFMDAHLSGSGFDDVLLCSDGQIPVPCTPAELAQGDAAASSAWGDANNDGHPDLFLVNDGTTNRFFQNLGGNSYSDVTTGRLDGPSNRGAAWADVDGDGDVDLFLSGTDDTAFLLRNDTPSTNHWLHVDLEGVVTNRFGVGARVTVHAGGIARVQEVGSGSGKGSSGPPTAAFGLGSTAVVDSVVVGWLSGSETYGPFTADQRVSLKEGSTTVGAGETAGVPAFILPSRPNPFRTETRIRFGLSEPAGVRLQIYDVAGRLVRTFDHTRLEPGTHGILWDGRDAHGRDVAAGTYFYRLDAGDRTERRSVVRVR